MKKLFWFLIVWLLLAIWVILYSDYNSQFKDTLCKKIKFCNHSMINQSNTISTWVMLPITTYVIDKKYDFISLYSWDDTQYYNMLIEKWVQCTYDPDVLIAGDITCFNVSWYQHIYEIKKLWMKIESFAISSSGLPTNNVLTKEEKNPFILSWDKFYDISDTSILAYKPYIEYHDMLPWETKDSILEQAKTKDYDGFVYDQERWITTLETGSVYIVSYRKWEEYPLFIQYHFQESKPYYYTADYGPDCNPWPCGLARHDIQLFTK